MQIKTSETHKLYQLDDVANLAAEKTRQGYSTVWVNLFTEVKYVDGKTVSTPYWEVECTFKHEHQTPTRTGTKTNEST